MMANDFDTKTLSEYIGYDRHHIYVLIRKHGLPSYKDGLGLIRFNKDDVDKWCYTHKKIRKGKVIVKCSGCGKDFEIHHYRTIEAKSNYCSIKCRINKKRVECDWCGKEIERIPAQIESHNFCSRECAGKYQTKNYSGENSKHWTGDYKKYYGTNWNYQRNLARERDKYSCKKCGKPETIKQHDVHHIKAFATFGIERYKEANELSNLVTLCNACHSSIEGRIKKGHKFLSRKKQIKDTI